MIEKSALDPNTPPKIRLAINLLWASWSINLLEFLFSMSSLDNDKSLEFGVYILILGSGFLLVLSTGLLIDSLSKRLNWARIALLVILFITIISYAWNFVSINDSSNNIIWDWSFGDVSILIDIAALIMLFSRSGSEWFASRTLPSP